MGRSASGSVTTVPRWKTRPCFGSNASTTVTTLFCVSRAPAGQRLAGRLHSAGKQGTQLALPDRCLHALRAAASIPAHRRVERRVERRDPREMARDDLWIDRFFVSLTKWPRHRPCLTLMSFRPQGEILDCSHSLGMTVGWAPVQYSVL